MPPIRVDQAIITLTGTSPLIMHQFGEKVQKQIEDKQGQVATPGRGPKEPDEELLANFYFVPGRESWKLEMKEWPLRDIEAQQGMFGFPASGFKKAAVTASRYIPGSGITMAFARGAFHVLGDILPLRWKEIRKGRDPVRLKGSGGASISYRPYFLGWEVDLTVSYNAGAISLEQIVNLFQHAGFSVGVGDWRPEKGGSYGMWRVKTG